MLTVYFICLISFLAPICIIITIEIHKIYKNYKILLTNKQKKVDTIKPIEQVLSIVEIYIKQKKWLSSLLFLESNFDEYPNYLDLYYNCTGFCYYNIKLYDLAKYYYSQAIKENSTNIDSLLNISKIYKLTNDKQKEIKIYKRILEIDSTNLYAQQQIKSLKNKDNRDSRI